MSGILAYALHYEGAFNKNSLGGVSEAAKLAGELGCEAHAVVIGDVSDELAATLGNYGVTKVFRAKDAPEGLAQPVVDVMAQVMDDNGHDYALFGGGLLGFEIGAGLAARLNAGVTMEVTQVNVVDGKLTAERPIHGDSSISTSSYKDRGIIIGRLNAFETAAPSDASRRGRGRRRRAVGVLDEGEDAPARRGPRRGHRHRGREHPRRRRARPRQARGLRAVRGAGRGARRRRRGDARGRRRRLVSVLDADRPDRQDGLAEALPRGRHLRRDPAQGRLPVLGEHRGDQQGLQRPDLRVLRPRHRRRPQQDPAQADRGREGEEGLGVAWPAATERRPGAGAVPAAGRSAGRVHQARPRPRGRADRGRRRDRRRRHGGPGLRQPPAAAARGRRGAARVARRGAGRGDREGEDLRWPQPVRRGHAPGPAGAALPRPQPRGLAQGGLRVRRRRARRPSTSCRTPRAR